MVAEEEEAAQADDGDNRAPRCDGGRCCSGDDDGDGGCGATTTNTMRLSRTRSRAGGVACLSSVMAPERGPFDDGLRVSR